MKGMIYDGRPVVLGAVPDPRAWLGREQDRPADLVAVGHFVPFDEARADGTWKGGSWAPTTEALCGRPADLVAAGHFKAFDEARANGTWKGYK